MNYFFISKADSTSFVKTFLYIKLMNSNSNSLTDINNLLEKMKKKNKNISNISSQKKIIKLQESLALLKDENSKLRKMIKTDHQFLANTEINISEIKDEILQIQKINGTNSINIIDKILLSKIDVEIKAEAIFKIKNCAPTDLHKNIQWINFLLKIPFKIYKTVNFDSNISNYLINRYSILDNSVYGLDSAKKQIIEFLSKIIRNPKSKGNVIALQGCPGIGKTKLIKHGISEALNRPFYVINFGGLRDSSILEGHDFTYINAKHGRIVNCLMKAGCMNPVIYLDEIDKISENHIEEISGVLTHLLDEEQHYEFYDNYFQGISIDLSKVLFVISFNDLSKINDVVANRIKIIKLPNPKFQDKIAIAEKFLIPEVISDIGLELSDISFDSESLSYLLSRTIKEDGVRQFKKNIQTIIEKLNASNLIGKSELYPQVISFPFNITKETIDKFLDSTDDEEMKFGMLYT